MTQSPCTLDELDALLDSCGTAEPMPTWLAAACGRAELPDLSDADLCDIAAERDDRGTVTTLAGLLQALRMRHGGDRVTLAMLAALEGYHLPALRDELCGL